MPNGGTYIKRLTEPAQISSAASARPHQPQSAPADLRDFFST
eukprot:SAG11_NODE_33994_length_274_cov_0.857143_1_plen_41_part_10